MPTIYRRTTFPYTNSNVLNDIGEFIFSAIYAAGYTVNAITPYTEFLVTLPTSYRNDYLYIKVYLDGSLGAIMCKRFYFYSTSGNQGIAETDSSLNYFGTFSSNRTLEVIVIASEDYLIIVYRRYQGSTLQLYKVISFTKINYFNNPLYTTTQSVDAGQNVSIPLASTSGILPNSYWIASTESLTGRTVVKVTSVSENSVTVESLEINLPSGSKLLKFCDVYTGGSLHSPYLTSSLPSGLSYPPQSSFETVVFQASRKSLGYFHILTPYSISHTDFPIALPLLLDYGVDQSPCGILAPDKVFYIPSITQQSVTIPADSFVTISSVDEGTISSSTSTTLTDTSKSWSTNSMVGKFVVLPSLKECKKITSNTSNTLTVNDSWNTSIPNGNSYYIYNTVYYLLPHPVSIGTYEYVVYEGENYTPTATQSGKSGYLLVKML